MLKERNNVFGVLAAAAICFLTIGFLLNEAAADQRKPVKLTADNWCPYNCDPEDPHPGFVVELARQIFGAAGHPVEYTVMPWTRAEVEVQSGRIDGLIGATKDEVPDFIFPREPIALTSDSFFVRRDSSWRYSGLPSLRKVSLGAIQGYSYDDTLTKYIESHSKQPALIQLSAGANALEINIDKLLAGRIQALVEDRNVMGHSLAKLGKSNEIIPAGALGAEELFIAFSPLSPSSKEYAEILTSGLQTMRQSGALGKILAKYGVSEHRVSKGQYIGK